MAVDHTLAGAFIDNNVEHYIFGRRCYPFSMWHRFLLTAIDSPFMAGGEVKLWDMRELVGICSLRYPKCKIRRPWVRPTLAFIFYRFLPSRLWTKFLVKTKDQILDYIGDYITRPEYTIQVIESNYQGPQVAPPPRLGPVPEIFVLLADVIHFLGCSEVEAWNMPLGKAYWYQMGLRQTKGDPVDFFGDDERAFQEEMRKAGMK